MLVAGVGKEKTGKVETAESESDTTEEMEF